MVDESIPLAALQADCSQHIGQRLTEAREQQQLSLEIVAAKLKLTVAVVQALESEDWSTVSISPTFMRGYLRNYAQLLKVSMLDDGPQHARALENTLLESVNQVGGQFYASSNTVHVMRRYVWLLVLVMLALVLWMSSDFLLVWWNNVFAANVDG